MSSPGTLRFAEVNTKPSAPPAGYNLIYVKTDDILYIQDSSGTEVALGSASVITSLIGDVLATGPGPSVATVVAIQGFAVDSAPPTDAEWLIYNTTANKYIANAMSGDATMTHNGVVTVGSVGGSSAANINSAELAANAATSTNTASTIVKRDASGNFAANIITAATFVGNVTGDVTGNVSGTAGNITATTNSTLTTLTALSLPGSQVTGDISGNAGNVTGVVAIANGGTGQITANAGFNALSPMTTLGDIIYENATPAAARLPGNTTTTREFLTSQGSAGLATAPTWSALVSGDIPNNSANTTGTASNITSTTNSTLTTLTALSLPTTQLSGAIVLTTQVSGVLPIANGGTNNSSAYTAGSVIFSNGTSLTQDNSQFYWDDVAKSLGVGTIPSAIAVIDVVNNSGTTKAIQLTGYGGNVGIRGRYANGTLGSPTAALNGNTLEFISGRGYGTSAFAASSTGAMNIVAAETFTDTSMATYMSFLTTPTGSVTSVERMRISPAGNMLIGTTTDNGVDLLQVNGEINVKSVKIAGATSGYVDLLVPAIVTTYNLTLPATTGTAGSVLATDGFGNLSFVDANANIDGGSSGTIYLISQFINGGSA